MRHLHGLGLATLCLLSASRWLVDNAAPSALPALEQQALHFAVVAVITLSILLFRSGVADLKMGAGTRIAGASILLLGAPALLEEVAYRAVHQSGVALFALVPLFVVVGAASLGSGQRSLMAPALVGVAGALLLLPFQLPATLKDSLLFGLVFLAVLLTAAGSLWLHDLLQVRPILPVIVVLCGVNAILLGGASLLHSPVWPDGQTLLVEGLRSILLDLPQIFLLVWLLREIKPVQLASRYLIAPLLTVIEGLIFLRTSMSPRMVFGAVLVLAAAAALLFWRSDDESEGASMLGLDRVSRE